MADSYTYEGTLNVTGDIRVNGRQVYTEAPKKYDMNGKIVTHRAIPIHTVRPGYRYCFPDGHIYIRGVEDADLQEESFEKLWNVATTRMNEDNEYVVCAWQAVEKVYDYSIVVYIPKDFDAHAFLTDSAYIEKLCFRTPNGILKTTSDFQIHDGKNVLVRDIGLKEDHGKLIDVSGRADQWFFRYRKYGNARTNIYSNKTSYSSTGKILYLWPVMTGVRYHLFRNNTYETCRVKRMQFGRNIKSICKETVHVRAYPVNDRYKGYMCTLLHHTLKGNYV